MMKTTHSFGFTAILQKHDTQLTQSSNEKEYRTEEIVIYIRKK